MPFLPKKTLEFCAVLPEYINVDFRFSSISSLESFRLVCGSRRSGRTLNVRPPLRRKLNKGGYLRLVGVIKDFYSPLVHESSVFFTLCFHPQHSLQYI